MKTFWWISGGIGALGLLVLLDPSHACRRHRAFTTISLTRSMCRSGNERNATASLKTLASAQADYRGNDRDGNKLQEYWRSDISGFYGVLPAGSTEMIKLIELSVAGADGAPAGKADIGDAGPGQVALDRYTVPAPKAGYLFRSLRHADEAPDALDRHNRFAACAYPANYEVSGVMTFIIDENNTIFFRDLGRPGPPDVYPDPETLKRDWEKLD
ncbi:MAG TPA: DUF2950 family protein [Planctomycetota bacterium]